MPKNRQALIRYHAIDACLRRRGSRFTLEELMEASSEAVAEATGDAKPVPKRTTQRDIQQLRGDYGAPIEVEDKKYYFYSEPGFSITNSPLSKEDVKSLQETLALLRQFEGFAQVGQLADIIQRVEDRISLRTRPVGEVVAFEAVAAVPGRHFLNPLYEAISTRGAVRLRYQPFHYTEPEKLTVSPHFLKEYNSRWYVLGTEHAADSLRLFALDRLQAVEPSPSSYRPLADLSPEVYFQKVIGVTLPKQAEVQTIQLWVSPQQAPYLKTRPWHASQQVVSEDKDGLILEFQLIPNYELRSKILSFGAGVKVLAPEDLAGEVQQMLQRALKAYEPLHPSG